MTNNEFKVIAHGYDIAPDSDRPNATEFKTETWVVLFSPDAADEWHASRPVETDFWEMEFSSLDEAEKVRLEHKQRQDALVDRLKKSLGIYGYAEVFHTMHEIFTVVHITTAIKESERTDASSQEPDPPEKKKRIIYRVNAMTLTDFMHFLRDHGWPVSLDKAKGMIEAGVFHPAAIAYKKEKQNGDIVTDYAIIPKRLERWFEKNADEVRIYNERP